MKTATHEKKRALKETPVVIPTSAPSVTTTALILAPKNNNKIIQQRNRRFISRIMDQIRFSLSRTLKALRRRLPLVLGGLSEDSVSKAMQSRIESYQGKRYRQVLGLKREDVSETTIDAAFSGLRSAWHIKRIPNPERYRLTQLNKHTESIYKSYQRVLARLAKEQPVNRVRLQEKIEASEKQRELALVKQAIHYRLAAFKAQQYHTVLGVKKNATPAQVNEAFRNIIKVEHTDKVQDGSVDKTLMDEHTQCLIASKEEMLKPKNRKVNTKEREHQERREEEITVLEREINQETW